MRTLFLLFSSLLLMVATGQAQMGTMQWQFKSRAEVVPALQKTRGNLHATYNVIVSAVRQGYGNSCAGYYEDFVVGHEFNSSGQDSAAYAFAYDVNSGVRPWDWKRDRDNSMIKKSSAATAQYHRERALKLLPNSPEVLTMRAFWGSGQPFKAGRQEGYSSALKAVKLAPKWADAYYWLQYATGAYANSFAGQITRGLKPGTPAYKEAEATVARLAFLRLRACNNAEMLNPSLKPYLLIDRVFAYDKIADQTSAQMIPKLVDAYLKAFPEWGEHIKKTTGETVQQYRQRVARDAAKMATEARKNG